MYRLNVTGPTGVEASFTVSSATLALDLALRSVRAGMCWTAEQLAPGRVQRLTLTALRRNAAELANDEAERRLLDEVEWQHELQSSFALN